MLQSASTFMKVLSVNVAQARPIKIGGRDVMTGIFKEPVRGRVRARRHALDGDVQADLRVHGGEHKAVYAYPVEHYAYWEKALARSGFGPGTFGENLTISGLLETDTHIGDVLRIGSAILQVTHPRMPCAKLAHKFGRPELIKEFLLSGRSGFYLRVEEEGELGAGDDIEIVRRDPNGVTVRQLLGLTDLNEHDPELARRAAKLEALPPSWREDVAAVLRLC
jgi:MOSC domain-containing protein YiiM